MVKQAYIQPHSFVKVVGDSLVPDNLPHGTTIYVADLKAYPLEKGDPYTQRIYVLGHKFNPRKGEPDIKEILMIDPKHLEQYPKGRAKTLMKKMEKFLDQETPKESTN